VSEHIRRTVEGPVVTLTLDRPERRNALDASMLRVLLTALDDAAADSAVRVVVLAAEGPTFCAGADLAPTGEGDASFAGLGPRLLGEVLESMVDHPKPIIGRVQGSAFGGGLGLIAACDLCVAADAAGFAFSEVRLGLVPALISPYVLRRVQAAAASELMLTGELFTAEVAVGAGLVTRVVGVAGLDTTIEAWVQQLLKGGPGAIAVTKRVLTRVPSMDRAAAAEWTTKVSAAAFASQEAEEGLAAFAGRRKAAWVPET
jgi:methylglutaconyl-CoA hydratase